MTPDPEFGSLLVASKPFSRRAIVALAFFIVITGLVTFLMGSMLFGQSGSAAPTPIAIRDMLPYLVAPAAGALVITVSVYFAAQGTRFYEYGVVRTFLGRTITRLAYADCVVHQFSMVHAYAHASYQGTKMSLVLRAADRKVVRFSTRHKLKVTRTGGLLVSTVQTNQQTATESLAWCSASILADQWIARLDSGESIDWTKHATLTPTGIAAWSGPAKGTIALYSELALIELNGDRAPIKMLDGTPFIDLFTGDENFYPGYLAATARMGSQP